MTTAQLLQLIDDTLLEQQTTSIVGSYQTGGDLTAARVSATHSAAAWPLHPRQVVSCSAVVFGRASAIQPGEGLGHKKLA